MSVHTTLPTLFGRFTAVMHGHQDLGHKLRLLREMCAALESGAQPLRDELGPERLLVALHADLVEHFTLEEADDYFGTVAQEEPTLLVQIEALKSEHLSMLEQLRGLLELARDAGLWQDLPQATRGLLGQLERHERAESALLRQLFFPRPE